MSDILFLPLFPLPRSDMPYWSRMFFLFMPVLSPSSLSSAWELCFGHVSAEVVGCRCFPNTPSGWFRSVSTLLACWLAVECSKLVWLIRRQSCLSVLFRVSSHALSRSVLSLLNPSFANWSANWLAFLFTWEVWMPEKLGRRVLIPSMVAASRQLVITSAGGVPVRSLVTAVITIFESPSITRCLYWCFKAICNPCSRACSSTELFV